VGGEGRRGKGKGREGKGRAGKGLTQMLRLSGNYQIIVIYNCSCTYL